MCPSDGHHQSHPSPIPDLRSAFQLLDADGDGKISLEDLRAFYAEYSPASAAIQDPIESMFSIADEDDDGYVDYERFLKVLGLKNDATRRCLMEKAFQVIDRDGDGIVGVKDLGEYMKTTGFDATYDEIRQMVKLDGRDGTAGVTFDGFLKILAVHLAD